MVENFQEAAEVRGVKKTLEKKEPEEKKTEEKKSSEKSSSSPSASLALRCCTASTHRGRLRLMLSAAARCTPDRLRARSTESVGRSVLALGPAQAPL